MLKRFLILKQLIAPESRWIWYSDNRPSFYQPHGLVLYVDRSIVRHPDGKWAHYIVFRMARNGKQVHDVVLYGATPSTYRKKLRELCWHHAFDHIVVNIKKDLNHLHHPKPKLHVSHAYRDQWDLALTAYKDDQIIVMRDSGTINEMLGQALNYGSLPLITISRNGNMVQIDRTPDSVMLSLLSDPYTFLEQMNEIS